MLGLRLQPHFAYIKSTPIRYIAGELLVVLRGLGLCSTQVFDVNSTLTHFRNSLTHLLTQAVRQNF